MSICDPETLLRCIDITIGYSSFKIAGLSFEIKSTDFIGILGPNGGGKSTLLKSIGNIIPLQYGKMERIVNFTTGYVPQHTLLDPIFPFTVEEVIRQGEIGRKHLPESTQNVSRRIEQLAVQFELTPLLSKPFRTLSGGQRQRTLIARSVVIPPAILLLDEPTSGLDDASSTLLIQALTKFRETEKQAVLMITHQPQLIHHLATHYFHLNFWHEHQFTISPLAVVQRKSKSEKSI